MDICSVSSEHRTFLNLKGRQFQREVSTQYHKVLTVNRFEGSQKKTHQNAVVRPFTIRPFTIHKLHG